ncbi:acetate uptake transporter [Candidatus Bathycorpusculum sp.]|jgi:succinate-acetate transporter protein|uniref:acetate uptake transporter n=1 Tax=Candidatus Bathycorpusculum sp. TaxID=2994959 RepID=UPI002820EEAE|nr:acetate uptake transporter [Candidatus Termitimicrobium sp.]MCL2685864.1 acetate uptake transporter [Candidatus Termitimicrobium sp.]
MSTKLANPAPLGLLGFGLTTVLLNLHNEGLFPLDTMILAMGLAYGGLAQLIVGIMEYRKGNTFGTVAFSSYGLFWWSLVGLLLLPKLTIFDGLIAPSALAMASYFFVWGVFTFAMFFGTLKANRALQFVFASLFVLFFLLSAGELLGNPTWLNTITGIEGIICGSSAIYLGIAEVLNETYQKTVLPICPTP